MKKDKENVAKRLWGALPNWKTPSEELEIFADKEFASMDNVEFVK